jgi:signal transduction histidine kinase
LTGDQQFAHDMKNLIGIMLGYSNLVLDGMPADDPRRSDIDEIRKAGESAVVLLDDWEAVSRR